MKTTPSTLNDTARTTTTPADKSKRHTSFDESITTSPEPYLYSQLSISEYRILNPQTAEIPTLTQSRLLAAVLERQQVKADRLARHTAIRRRFISQLKSTFLHPWLAFNELLNSTGDHHRRGSTISHVGRA